MLDLTFGTITMLVPRQVATHRFRQGQWLFTVITFESGGKSQVVIDSPDSRSASSEGSLK
jgi:hypothetical protein